MTDAAADTERISPLGNLKDRRQAIVKETTLKLQVPRWHDPEIWVEYDPADHKEIRAGQRRLERVKGKERSEAEINSNADLLINNCLRVYAILEGREFSLRPGDPQGEFTVFDSDLAENLGIEEGATARRVCRELFITDGDLAGHATSLIRWSGFRVTETDEEFEGE